MKINKIYRYFVEGETEKKVIEALKNKYLESGKITVKNIANKKLTTLDLGQLKPNTICVLIFDKDIFVEVSPVGNQQLVLENIEKLKKSKNVKEIICICQNKNLEDELIKSTNIKQIKDLLDSSSNSDFKKEIIKCSNVLKKLEEKSFDISKFWIGENLNWLSENKSIKIKI